MLHEDDPISNEDAMLEEHDEFMRQVSESGVPLYLLQYYGEPNFKSLNNADNQETTEIGHNDPSTSPSI